jgi:hypothetical protein
MADLSQRERARGEAQSDNFDMTTMTPNNALHPTAGALATFNDSFISFVPFILRSTTAATGCG